MYKITFTILLVLLEKSENKVSVPVCIANK